MLLSSSSIRAIERNAHKSTVKFVLQQQYDTRLRSFSRRSARYDAALAQLPYQ
jgi:hypothetical protein